MKEHKSSEVLHNGMSMSLLVPVEQLDSIDQVVDQTIQIQIDDLIIVGTLTKISTALIKEKGAGKHAEKEIFKVINIVVDKFDHVVRNLHSVSESSSIFTLVSFPDRKESINNDITFYYGKE